MPPQEKPADFRRWNPELFLFADPAVTFAGAAGKIY
jgi:hypothetical protein